MFESLKLPRALREFYPFALISPKLLQLTASQADGGTKPKQDEPPLERLLSRAEAELAEPAAIQRRDTIARLKVAAVNGRD